MISYGKQSISDKDIQAVVNVLKSEFLTQGPVVEKFENGLKNYFGAKHVCAVSNGTAALHLAGLALGWQKEDIIITTPMSFLATANCIVYAGATPHFVDIDKITHNIKPSLVEKEIIKISKNGKRVKAIIGVDYAGYPCDWKNLRKIADKYGCQLVNDNCHALGAKYFNEKEYGLKYADVVTQSYHPVKNFTTGEGGAVLTNDIDVANKIKILRSHGMTKNLKHYGVGNDGPWYYEMNSLGYNYRITDIQCALGINQLKKLDEFIFKRNEIAKHYNDSFKNDERFIIPEVAENIYHSYHLYPLQINFKNLKIDKVMLFNEMRKKNIILQVHYIPITKQPFYKSNFSYDESSLTNAYKFYKNVISMPIYYDLSINDQDYVIKSIKSLLK